MTQVSRQISRCYRDLARSLVPGPIQSFTPVYIPVAVPVAALTMGTLLYSPGALAAGAVGSATGVGQVAIVLLLVVGLIAGMAWLMRRLGVARNSVGTALRIVGGVNLSSRERILVVEIAEQWIVVGVTTAAINTLATMPRPEQAKESGPGRAPPMGKSFALWLKQTVDKRNPGNVDGSAPASTNTNTLSNGESNVNSINDGGDDTHGKRSIDGA